MKKLAFILSFMFVASLGMVSIAAESQIQETNTITIVDLVDDKEECKKGCTCEKCDTKTAEATKTGTKAEAKECCKKSKECTKKETEEAKK